MRFHTFRHWKATAEYLRTKDAFHVMQMLEHKNIKNALMYTQLQNFQNDDFACKAAKPLLKQPNSCKQASNTSQK